LARFVLIGALFHFVRIIVDFSIMNVHVKCHMVAKNN